MLPTGSLSEAAYGLRQLLIARIDDLEDDIGRIRIGHPGTNLKTLDDAGENGLNLFFYHVSYDGYPADGTADNPFYVRLYCLLTAVGHELKKNAAGNTTGRDISKGENELRLIGEVMKVLHQNSVFTLADSANQAIASLQIVPHAVNLDDLNHIWATQGSDTPYRLSVAYELSLAPVPLATPSRTAPLIGEPRTSARGALAPDSGTGEEDLLKTIPTVEYLEIDTGAADWMPHLALVSQAGGPTAALHYVFKVESAVAVPLDVLLAGAAGEEIRLCWNIWRRKTDNSIVAWREDIPDGETPLATIRPASPPPNAFQPNRVDPAAPDARGLFKVRLPAEIGAADTKTWQATLVAVRDWRHDDPAGSGAVSTAIRSNLLLLYGEGA